MWGAKSVLMSDTIGTDFLLSSFFSFLGLSKASTVEKPSLVSLALLSTFWTNTEMFDGVSLTFYALGPKDKVCSSELTGVL
jgi:hypothetical protein